MLSYLLIATCLAVLSSAADPVTLQWEPEAEPELEDPSNEEQLDEEWIPITELEEAWESFKVNHARNYTDRKEEMARKKIFAENLKEINENNELYSKGLKTFTMGINQFADMDDSEFLNLMTDSFVPEDLSQVSAVPTEGGNLTYPSHLDWRNYGYVTRVKHQGNCCSGWAFSATGALEGQFKKRTGRLVSLSEQQLIDCSYGNSGCYGGWPHTAFAYITKNHGIDMEAYYTYQAKDGCCRYRCSYRGAMCRSYVYYRGISEYSLQGLLYSVGPLSVAIDASRRSFRFYRGGVYYDPYCKSALGKLNHDMLLIGYGTCLGRPYWTVKNSFGTSWGMRGYIRMSRNRYNNCGISTYAAYPVV